ncbi:PREDICTED: protein FAM64A isoform X1 [Crocodylus porosus]|uniref:protein FAM64A isoform X1 n=1 Tax=Crocodylus porosus TaxID=8502 RepID=UPI00093A0559|nr:PREDICTED: protein FAM64A isoform X1 [Crocodylus porosus]
MASMFQSVGSSAGWRKHQLLADIDENESPVPDKFKKRPSSSSLNTICMSLRKRMPLKQVELNLHENPTWESLEAKEKQQTFRAITRTARNAFGTVSQKIQKSCQNPMQPLVTSPARAPARSSSGSSSAKKRSTPPQTPRRKNGFSRTAAPASGPRSTPRSSKRASLSSGSARNFQVKEWRSVSNWLGKDALPLRRSRRAAALKSPYSSPPSATGKRQAFECELELVSTGIRQLKRLSQVFDDAIVRQERKQAISNYHHLMAQNLKSLHHSRKLSQSFRRRMKRLHQAIGTRTEMALRNFSNL